MSVGTQEKRELVFDRITGKKRLAVSEAPQLTSSNTKWSHAFLEEHSLPSFDNPDVFFLNHMVILGMRAPIQLEWKSAGRSETIPLLPSHFNLLPAKLTHSARSLRPSEFLMLSMPPNFIENVAYEAEYGDQVELVPNYAVDDPLVAQTALALRQEAKSGGTGGKMYGDTLATSLGVHLLRHYSARAPRIRQYQGGLTKDRLRRALEFMQEHLSDDISLENIATVTGISPFHFCRMFKRSTGLAPHQYLMKCRIEKSRELLISTTSSISDIAFQVGFCDQSHLTRHFKRAYGVTPREFWSRSRK